MRRFRRVLAVMLAVLLISGGAAVWAGPELYEGYQVVRVVVNGKSVESPVPAIVFNGSTLIPLRAVSEAMGAKIDWDGATWTASLTTAQTGAGDAGAQNTQVESLQKDLNAARNELQGTKATLLSTTRELDAIKAELDAANKKLAAANPPPSEIGRGRSNPMPTGTTLVAALTQSSIEFTGRFTLTQVIRGDEAWAKIKAANQFNDPPAAGHEYILAKMKVEIVSTSDADAAISVSSYWFTAVSGTGRDYPSESVVEPEPEVDTKLYKGASHEGWFAVMVEKTDTAPLLTFARDSQGRNGYWMQLKPIAGASASSSSGSTAQPDPATPAPPATMTKDQVKSAETLAAYLNQHHGSVVTPSGAVKVTYEVMYNDRTFFAWDYWIMMRYEPRTFFSDLITKNTITATERSATAEKLREHAQNVYSVAAEVFPGKKLHGQYYTSWYEYPTLQVGFEARRYLSWQNYDENLLGSGDPYARTSASTFRFVPLWDDYKF